MVAIVVLLLVYLGLVFMNFVLLRFINSVGMYYVVCAQVWFGLFTGVYRLLLLVFAGLRLVTCLLWLMGGHVRFVACLGRCFLVWFCYLFSGLVVYGL